MAKRRVTIDVEDDEGAVFRMTVTGKVTREKILKVFETMNLIDVEAPPEGQTPDSVGGRIWAIVERNYPIGKFTSSTILEKYEDEYNLPIKLSVISTYLARFTHRGRLARTRNGREWSYRAADRAILPQRLPLTTPRP